MAKFILSAFADEYSPEIDKQIEGLKKNGIDYMEIRGVDGTNISDITLEKAEEVHAKLKAAGIGVSSIGSPIGKINDHGKEIEFSNGMEKMGPVMQKLYDTLTGIQMGRIEAPEGWIVRID